MPANTKPSNLVNDLQQQLRDNTFYLEAARFMRAAGNLDQQVRIDELEERENQLVAELCAEGMDEYDAGQIVFEVRQRWAENL